MSAFLPNFPEKADLIIIIFSALFMLLSGSSLKAQTSECGKDFSTFIKGVKQQAIAQGINNRAVNNALKYAQLDPKILSRDRAQHTFRQTFLEFSQRSVSKSRLQYGVKNLKKYSSTFNRARQEFGIPAPVIAASWGQETDFGVVQGDFNTINALTTLSHDCRRPELFRPQLIAAIKMVENGDLSPLTTGAWAGEIGQMQMLPEDILRFGIDGDNDGHVRLKESSPDAILTAANFIHNLGWEKDQPWLVEVIIPSDRNFPYEKTGLEKDMTGRDWANLGVKIRTHQEGRDLYGLDFLKLDLLLPQGHKGPAFLAFPNFSIYLKWNQSFIYAISTAYFATRLDGAPPYNKGEPEAGLNTTQMKALQKKLINKGYDVGKVDGILGRKTRHAVQVEQLKSGIKADAWPTLTLYEKL